MCVAISAFAFALKGYGKRVSGMIGEVIISTGKISSTEFIFDSSQPLQDEVIVVALTDVDRNEEMPLFFPDEVYEGMFIWSVVEIEKSIGHSPE
jgi:hypothetical protein